MRGLGPSCLYSEFLGPARSHLYQEMASVLCSQSCSCVLCVHAGVTLQFGGQSEQERQTEALDSEVLPYCSSQLNIL